MSKSVIVAGKRSPIGKLLGGLADLSAVEIGVQVAKAVLKETDAIKKGVDEVFIGNVLPAGLAQAPARQVALKAGLPDTMPCVTLNKVCGSSLEAVIQADRAIRCGDINVALCGGIESMTNAPHLLMNGRKGTKFGPIQMLDHMEYDGLRCAFEKWIMGCAADYIAEKHNVTREDQDKFSFESHKKATEANAAGQFDKERIAIETRKGPFNTDEMVRTNASLEDMAKLKPVFKPDGTVTAGNSSGISDGAAMVLIASDSAAKKNGWNVRAEILSTATSGVAPKDLFIAPVYAVRQVVEKAGLSLDEIDLFEINEAFAAQMVACIRGLEIPEEKVNVHGGAVAMGHPIGASGARTLVTLLHAMEQRNAKIGVVSLCLGGGNAVAACIRRP